MMVNGFGLRWIDFHDPGEDGSAVATQWVMVAFFPIAPRRRARLRVGEARERGVPGVAQVSSTPIVEIEQLALDPARTGRVYRFYYGVFLPLVILPTLGALAVLISFGSAIPASVFWGGFIVWMACGIATVAFERRRMGPPRVAASRLI
jgi:hypothetical protein